MTTDPTPPDRNHTMTDTTIPTGTPGWKEGRDAAARGGICDQLEKTLETQVAAALIA